MDLNQINSVIKKATSPQGVKDFDAFLDDLPVNVGYNALIAAGITCLMAAAAVWFTAGETEKVSKLHSDLMNVQALQPPVPVLKYMPVPRDVLKAQTDKIVSNFKGITVNISDGSIVLNAQDTDYFPQFLAAISYLQRGGKDWKVKINTLCVGRDCQGSKVSANLKIEMVRFGEPEKKEEKKEETKN
jgi:hypothetical protein